MTKSVLFITESDGKKTAVINLIPDWEGFERLINYLDMNYQTNILASYDGPDARRWIMEVNGKVIELIHDDVYGNYFLAPTPDSDAMVRQIGDDLEERLQHIDE